MNYYPEDVLTVDEVCEILHIGRNTCTQLLRSGQLKGFRIGTRVWTIPRDAVNQFISEQMKKC